MVKTLNYMLMKKLLLLISALIISVPSLLAQEITVTLNFIGHDMGDDVYQKVFISTEAFSGSFEGEIDVDSDHYTFNCTPAVGLNFEPKDDYILLSLTSDITDPGAQNIQGGKYQRSITILPGAPSQVNLYLEVAPEGYSSVAGIGAAKSTFPVYNLLGVKVMEASGESDLRNLHKGIYVIKGKKYIVR